MHSKHFVHLASLGSRIAVGGKPIVGVIEEARVLGDMDDDF